MNVYIEKLIKLAKAHNIKIYYYTMPFNKSSFEATSACYKRGYCNYILQIAKNYNITICNKLSFLPNDYFGDPSHLYKGSAMATKELLDCVH